MKKILTASTALPDFASDCSSACEDTLFETPWPWTRCNCGHPCHDHIRGQCKAGESCKHCHKPFHAIRKKQYKQQRRLRANAKTRFGFWSGAWSCAYRRCLPCEKHILGQCTLGTECVYCHDSVHAREHSS